MEILSEHYDALLQAGAKRLRGHQRRLFLAEVTLKLCDGNVRQAERRFGWGRETIRKGLQELQQGIRCLENFAARGRPRWEEENPQRAADIRAIAEPQTQADPELLSERRYTNLTAEETLELLRSTKGYAAEDLPSVRSMRDILNRMGYRLKRIQKAKPLKKTPETDAIFANVKAVRHEVHDDPTTLEISIDTKAKVKEGEYSRGGKSRTDSAGETPKGLDHDPPPKRKWTPFGVLMLATGALTLIFGSGETSDFWVDALQRWWEQTRGKNKKIRQLVIYLDNGPNNSGTRTQFLKRMIEFADWAQLTVRLVFYPPYHSKYNRIERCWSSLEKKWGGTLLTNLKVILARALRMTWLGKHPVVTSLEGDYPDGVRLSKKEMKPYEARLERSETLPKYDITIKPKSSKRRVN
jgi:transposase